MDSKYLPVRADRPADLSRDTTAAPASPAAGSAGDPALSLFEILLRRKWTVIGCTLLGLLLGGVYLWLAPPTYSTQAKIFVERNNLGQPNSPLSPRGVSAGLPSTHVDLLRSSPVLELALQDPAVAESSLLAEADDKVKELREKLEVSSSKDSETVTVSLTGRDPREIAEIVNAVVRAYLIEQHPWLATRLDGGEAAATGEGGGIMSDRLTATRLEELSSRLTQAENDAAAAAMRLAQGRQAEGDVAMLTQLLGQSGLSTQNLGLDELSYLRYERARVKMALDSLPDAWGPDHLQRQPIERQYRSIEREMRAFEDSTSAAMLGMLSETARQAGERRVGLAADLRVEQAAAEARAELPVRVIDPAQEPRAKAGPKAGQTLAVAMVLGFFGGALLAIGQQLSGRDAAYAGPADGPATSATNEASTLPALQPDAAERSAMGPVLGVVPEIPAGRRLASPNFDASASSIHQVRAVLQVHARRHGLCAYAFTSPRRGAGKTSVTIGVATSLAMSGTRTLVVDTDLAGRIARGQRGRPAPAADPYGPIAGEGSSPHSDSLDDIAVNQGYLADDDSRAMAAPAAPGGDGPRLGVTGMLDGGTLDECAIPATVDGLSLLPAVAAETRHIGQMSDAFVRRVIEEARGRFDLVLFDTGPIPGSTEALLVASQADGVVLVVPEDEDRSALDRTLSYLKVVDAKIVGTVFNRSKTNADATGKSAKPASDAATDLMARDGDDEALDGDRALGSGILAAAVFSDAESGYANDRWELKNTSGTDTVSETLKVNPLTEPRDQNEDEAEPDARVERLDDSGEPTVFKGSVDELFARANGDTPRHRRGDGDGDGDTQG